MKYFSKIYLVLFFASLSLFAQNKNNVLAKVDGKEITTQEYKLRYELMPFPKYEQVDKETRKEYFLYSLIAELLLEREAVEESLDTLQSFQNSVKMIEKNFLRDELYRKKIESKIQPTENEIRKSAANLRYILKTDFFYSKDSASIYEINTLLNTISVDSLLKLDAFPSVTHTPYDVNVGKLKDIDTEQYLFDLQIGRHSHPIKFDDYWSLFVINDVTDNPEIQGKTNKELLEFVINSLRERKRYEVRTKYTDSIFVPAKVEVNGDVFPELVDRTYDLLKDKQLDSNGVLLTPEEVHNLFALVDKQKLKSDFVLFDKDPVSLNEYLVSLSSEGIRFNDTTKETIYYTYRLDVKTFIEKEMLVREALKNNLDELTSFKEDLSRWRQNLLANFMIAKILQEQGVEREDDYNAGTDNARYKIYEVHTTNLNIVEKIINRLSTTNNLGKIVHELSIDKNEIVSGSEKIINPFNYGKVGIIVARLEPGEVYGPITLDDGYSIVQLIEKINEKETISGDEQKNNAKKKPPLSNLLTDKIVDLANKYNVEINLENLKQLELLNMNTFTYRRIGFGGKMLAVPMTYPLYEWFYKWKHGDDSLP